MKTGMNDSTKRVRKADVEEEREESTVNKQNRLPEGGKDNKVSEES